MVKYLVIPTIESINASLQRIDFGDHSICGRLSCFTLKMVQKDKKLVKHLQREYSNEKIMEQHINKNRNVNPEQLGDSIEKLMQVPVGNLHEFSTVRLISYFISTLNTTYTDFDFTSCEPNQFQMEKPQIVHETINARLSPLTKLKPLLMNSFWQNINSVMDLQQCQFYSFMPNDDVMQVLRPHSLWNIDYFIVNIKKKQLLYLSLYAQNNLFEKKPAMDSMDEFKGDMDVDIDEVDVNDGMAWCPSNEMSPPHSPKNHNKNNNNNNGNGNGQLNAHRQHHQQPQQQQAQRQQRNANMARNHEQALVHNNGVNNHRNNEIHANVNNNHAQQARNNHNQLHVMSIDNCLGSMPELERPSDF